jgi:hypothetical protein
MARTPNEIIDEIQRIRGRNNDVWMKLVRLAWRLDPEEAKRITADITANDAVILSLSTDLSMVNLEMEKAQPDTKRAVLLPGGGVLHTYAVREALSLGLTPIVTDRDSNCPCAKIPGVEFHQIDCYDVDAHLNLLDLCFSFNLEGAFCGGADTHVVVAAVHEAMGWKGRWVSRKTAETCKDKLKAKIALSAAEVPTAQMRTEPPFISKPLSASGSRGVRRCMQYEDIHDTRRWKAYLQEELLEGPEQSVEIVLAPGRLSVLVNIVDRHFAWVDDQPLEWGHTNPSRLSRDQQNALYELAFNAANAVGATVGFFKCDTIWTKDGPKVLECTPRLSGGYDSQLSTPMSSGRNLLRYGLQLACGMPLDEKLLERTKSETVTVIHRPELAGVLEQKL